MKSEWKSNPQLVENGWRFFSLVRASDTEFTNKQLDRFLSTITVDSDYGADSGEKHSEMYVRAFPNIPANQNPGAGFVQIGCRKPEEPLDENYRENLKRVFKETTGKDITSMLVLPGPFYAPSSVVPGQFERVSGYDKIIWAR